MVIHRLVYGLSARTLGVVGVAKKPEKTMVDRLKFCLAFSLEPSDGRGPSDAY